MISPGGRVSTPIPPTLLACGLATPTRQLQVCATNASEWESDPAAAAGSSEKDKGAEVVDACSESTVFPIIVPVADFFNHHRDARSGVQAKVMRLLRKPKPRALVARAARLTARPFWQSILSSALMP